MGSGIPWGSDESNLGIVKTTIRAPYQRTFFKPEKYRDVSIREISLSFNISTFINSNSRAPVDIVDIL